jgi:hypothetical protein
MGYGGIQMTQELQVYLYECRCPDSVAPVNSSISKEQNISSVKGWMERCNIYVAMWQTSQTLLQRNIGQ